MEGSEFATVLLGDKCKEILTAIVANNECTTLLWTVYGRTRWVAGGDLPVDAAKVLVKRLTEASSLYREDDVEEFFSILEVGYSNARNEMGSDDTSSGCMNLIDELLLSYYTYGD
jgi:hypothetical protein